MTNMSLLKTGIVKSQNETCDMFEKLFPDILEKKRESPSAFIKDNWKIYQNHIKKSLNNNRNGTIFEYLLAVLLYKEKITPLFIEAKVAFVPNVNFDLLLYSKEYGPVCLSAKTSLRERYKQADLEAIALTYVHRTQAD